jgi:hypothetical protein
MGIHSGNLPGPWDQAIMASTTSSSRGSKKGSCNQLISRIAASDLAESAYLVFMLRKLSHMEQVLRSRLMSLCLLSALYVWSDLHTEKKNAICNLQNQCWDKRSKPTGAPHLKYWHSQIPFWGSPRTISNMAQLQDTTADKLELRWTRTVSIIWR